MTTQQDAPERETTITQTELTQMLAEAFAQGMQHRSRVMDREALARVFMEATGASLLDTGLGWADHAVRVGAVRDIAEVRREVIAWYEDQGLHHLKHDAEAREHFEIEEP